MTSSRKSTSRRKREDPPTLEWLRALPKAELHLHLLGGIRSQTAVDLARKNHVKLPYDPTRDWGGAFHQRSLSAFVESFISLFDLLRDSSDFERLAIEVLEDLASDGVKYTEPRITITSHLTRGVSEEAIGGGLQRAARKMKASHGVEVGWIIDFPRVLGIQTAESALAHAIRGKEWGVTGFDIAGYEGHSPEDPALIEIFEKARESGLGLTAHVGEKGPPDHVWTAIRDWKVNRIGHGIQSIHDPALVEELVHRQIPLEVCPSSNVALGAVPNYVDHPVDDLFRAGVPVTLNTDDPTLFGTTLSEEILRTADLFGWSRADVEKVVENGWRYRFRGDLPGEEEPQTGTESSPPFEKLV